MNLVRKLLHRHISIPQFLGYFFANILGMFIVLLAVQFYSDVIPMFSGEDNFFKKQYVVVSKHIGTAGAFSGKTNVFTQSEIDELAAQPFAKRISTFTSSSYKVSASVNVSGNRSITTDLFFDAVDDYFVDADKDIWQYTPGEKTVPIILPRTYLTLYNFGFAKNYGLPGVSEGLAGMIDMKLIINSGNSYDVFNGKIVGFSGRLNTMLVPRSFMDWSNEKYGNNVTEGPLRLVVEVDNITDARIAKYMDSHGLEVEEDKLDAGRMTYFLKIVTGLVLAAGLLISILSFYILMLSIYLLVEKNTDKLENLLLIGYSTAKVAFPYQLLTLVMNACVLVVSLVAVLIVRNYYLKLISLMYPQISGTQMTAALVTGLLLYLIVSIINITAIRNRINYIWHRRK